jgi:hypothetical protein
MNLTLILIYQPDVWVDVQLQVHNNKFHLHFVIFHIGFCLSIFKVYRG